MNSMTNPEFKKVDGGWQWAQLMYHVSEPELSKEETEKLLAVFGEVPPTPQAVFFVAEHPTPVGESYSMEMRLPASAGGTFVATDRKPEKELWFTRAAEMLEAFRSGRFDWTAFPEAWIPA